MDELLPTEILIEIFKYLSAKDIETICKTCTSWRNIVTSFGIWEFIWLNLLQTVSKTNVEDDLYDILKKIKPVELNLPISCVRLQNILYDENNQIHDCLLHKNVEIHQVALLQTHFSKIRIVLGDSYSLRSNNHTEKYNNANPTSASYMLFRQPPALLDTIESLFKKQGHIKYLIWIYPLGVYPWLDEVTSILFEKAHVEDVLRIPRVIVLCENLELSDALVVVSTARSTEVAVVLDNGLVAWAECPVGGWRIAQCLHDTYTWLHLGEQNPNRFESPHIKAQCWVPPHKISRRCQRREYPIFTETEECFVLKDELYLSAELMYTELNLIGLMEKVSEGLSQDQKSRCFSHVVLAGGNCKLQHLATRVRLDLVARWPAYADVIHTSVHTSPELLYTPPEIARHFSGCTRAEYVCDKSLD